MNSPLRHFPALLALAALTTTSTLAQNPAPTMPQPFGLVLHGGAGVIKRDQMTPELEANYRATLRSALDTGYAVLARGGSALDAVVATVTVLEDSPLFNAGKGAVFTADGICELDASIMNGATLQAGATAGLRRVRNPIKLVREIMENSPHVMMIGDGAEKFAESRGHVLVPNEYFHTEFRRNQLEKAKQKETRATNGTASVPLDLSSPGISDRDWFSREQKYGTVGCVALDQHGNLAAGTSTGGMTNKKFGRVGDVPVIGAGTYAKNATCAVSTTGWGEFFIRATVAHDISAQMEYAGRDVASATAATLAKVAQLGGDGGVIALDRAGNLTMDFNSEGMYRAARISTRPEIVAIYGDEPRR